MKRSGTLSKKKGVLLMVEDLYTGLTRIEIVKKFEISHKIKMSTVDSWIRAAKPLLESRVQAEELAKRAKIKETNDQMIERLGLQKEVLLAELKKIALSDIRDMYDDEGELIEPNLLSDSAAGAVSGIEVESKGNNMMSKRIKRWDKKGAIQEINYMLGYYMPKKIADTDADGNDLPVTKIGYGKKDT